MGSSTPQKKPRRGSSRRGQQTSTREIMLSQRNVDGGPGVLHENGESENAQGNLVPESTAATNPNLPRVKKRYMFTFAMVVFFGQIGISVTLKRYGWIEKDFNELVAERLVPTIQEHAEQLVETGFNFQKQLFNDSAYLHFLNQSLGQSTQERHRPGLDLKKKGVKATYPIIIVPGFVTSGLEVWEAKECAQKYFRQRMWGGVGMVQRWLMERFCVLEHMSLDPFSGLDPEGIRIRAAQGFEAADFFLANYWVFNPLIENLADIGYDAGMMSIETYDWRLAFPKLEERDGYLTKLKYKIESFHKSFGKKVVLTSHSMGALLVHYFFTWVTTSEKRGGGGGGKDWVDKHVHAYVNIAGTHLGVAKAASALISGEMSDTILLGPAGDLVEQFLGRKPRRDLWMSWGSLWSMLPASKLWDFGADLGSQKPGQDDVLNQLEDALKNHFLVITDEDNSATVENSIDSIIDEETESIINQKLDEVSSKTALTTREAMEFLSTWGGGLGPAISGGQLHSFDPDSKPSQKSWSDVSRTPLPSAPNMKVYCFYGVGLPTERAYFYKRNRNITSSEDATTLAIDMPFILDTSVEDPENSIIHGVKYADGDASVPLLSLGYICADAWRRQDSGLNPFRLEVTVREYKHRQEFTVDDPMRGGPYSADHVDILGNFDMMQDFLKLVSGFETETVDKDHFESDILSIANELNGQPGGGIYKQKRKLFNT